MRPLAKGPCRVCDPDRSSAALAELMRWWTAGRNRRGSAGVLAGFATALCQRFKARRTGTGWSMGSHRATLEAQRRSPPSTDCGGMFSAGCPERGGRRRRHALCGEGPGDVNISPNIAIRRSTGTPYGLDGAVAGTVLGLRPRQHHTSPPGAAGTNPRKTSWAVERAKKLRPPNWRRSGRGSSERRRDGTVVPKMKPAKHKRISKKHADGPDVARASEG